MYLSLDQKDHPEKSFRQLVQEGITAARTGDRSRAIRLLMMATQVNPAEALPWIWLSATTDDPLQQRKYLEYAVAAEPGNATARRGLVILSGKIEKSRLLEEGEAVKPRRSQELDAAQAFPYLCSKCGGRVVFDVRKDELVCEYCGEARLLERRYLAGDVEQPVDYILPTTQGHYWAETLERVTCERCGAIAIMPPGQSAGGCAYCASNRLVKCVEAEELIEPQAIALMKLDADESLCRVKKWLSQGLFAPDDLTARSNGVDLRPAYYPFWAFDGTLELSWRCEVNEGSSKTPRWVARSGSEFQFFDDVLVPGTRALVPKEIAGVEPFPLEELVEFQPEYLVGWQAFTYDRAMSDAILQARQKVVTDLRKSLATRVEPGLPKRNINAGAGKWSGLTFKYILLPLWIGSYAYRGKEHHLLVNGLTGKVAGDKPRDNLKVATFVFGLVILVLFLGYMLFWLWNQQGAPLLSTAS